MTSEANQRLQGAYDRIAADYARTNAVVPLEYRDHLFPKWLAIAGRRAGGVARVLDAGCGAGRDLAWFEGLGVPIVGIDLSQGMLAEARTRFAGSLLQMDMR